jgi:hypothetical protein
MGQGDMFANTRRHHDVRALTRIMGALKAEHPYRREQNAPRLMLLRGAMCHNSADLLREAVRIADEWRYEMMSHLPQDTIDLTKDSRDETLAVVEVPVTLGEAVIDSVAAQINAGALNGKDVTVTAKVTKGRK